MNYKFNVKNGWEWNLRNLDYSLEDINIRLSSLEEGDGSTEPVVGLSPEQEEKLESVESGAQKNVNPDWNSSTGFSHILNKPVFGAAAFMTGNEFATVEDLATTKSEVDNKADLVSGKVPESQLPSYVDNVQEFASVTLFPAIGESNIIYLDTTSNLPYRWGGSSYVQISSGLALGETSSTAYRGDRGKIAYDHSLLTGNPHNLNKSDISLGNVDNTSDLNKPISTSTQTALNGKMTAPTVNTSIPIVNGSGTHESLPYTAAATSNTVVVRNSDGRFSAVDPTQNQHVATKNYVDQRSGAPVVSTVSGWNVRTYSDRVEYSRKISFTQAVGTGGARYQTYNTNISSPTGITVANADEHYLSLENPNRTVCAAVYQGTDGSFRIGVFNNYNDAAATSISGRLFIKLVRYL